MTLMHAVQPLRALPAYTKLGEPIRRVGLLDPQAQRQSQCQY